MKRFGTLKSVRFDKKELSTDLGSGNFIFVGSSCDMFAKDIPDKWIEDTISKCNLHDNRYLFQSKNPGNMALVAKLLNHPHVVCTTIETNRVYPNIMQNSPSPQERMQGISSLLASRFITIEPIIDFDLEEFIKLLKECHPTQVSIGADSGGNNLPEPSKDKVIDLINALHSFTTIAYKKNLKRIVGDHVWI